MNTTTSAVIENEFLGYVAKVYKDTVLDSIQMRDVKRTFFAGAVTVLVAFEKLRSPGVPDRIAIDTINAMNREAKAFVNAVREGRA